MVYDEGFLPSLRILFYLCRIWEHRIDGASTLVACDREQKHSFLIFSLYIASKRATLAVFPRIEAYPP